MLTKKQKANRAIRLCRNEDGAPPNGASIVGSGTYHSQLAGTNEGDYFLRTDFVPNRLFQKEGARWKHIRSDTRKVHGQQQTKYSQGLLITITLQ